jgi:hypothetical protein
MTSIAPPTKISSHVSGEIGNESPDYLGSFNGYIRRPKPSAKGVIAQFYGENGVDADTIVSLSMTQYQNAHIRAAVYWIKDSVGAVKKERGGYPLIANFESFIRRSIPTSTGMVATLFAANGPHSDVAHQLGFTKYLDSFVHVQLYRFVPDESSDTKQPEHLNQAIAIPPQSAHARPTGAFKTAESILHMQGFFRENAIWAALGGELEFQKWLKDRTCCAPVEPPCRQIGVATAIPNSGFESYAMVPLCSTHSGWLTNRIQDLGGMYIVQNKRQQMVVEWSIEALCKTLQTPSLSFTHPNLVLSWAVKHGVDALLPVKYRNLAVSQ